MPHTWQYLLVGATDDRDLALSRALAADGSSVLVRTVDDSDLEESARRDGSWGDTDRLARIKYRGDIAWAVPIGAQDARQVVSAWHAAGRFDAEPPVDETVPVELAARLDANAVRRDRSDRLRNGPGLDTGGTAEVRARLLDGPADLDAAWVAEPGRVVVPVQSALKLSYPEDIGRTRRAFALGGATSLWVVSTSDAEKAARWNVPAGVSLPNQDDWLAGLGSLYFATGDVVITTPALDAAILQADEYGLVGGSPEFVETVLGRDVDAAREAFRAYLRGESYRSPRGDLTRVADRYLDQPAPDASPTS